MSRQSPGTTGHGVQLHHAFDLTRATRSSSGRNSNIATRRATSRTNRRRYAKSQIHHAGPRPIPPTSAPAALPYLASNYSSFAHRKTIRGSAYRHHYRRRCPAHKIPTPCPRTAAATASNASRNPGGRRARRSRLSCGRRCSRATATAATSRCCCTRRRCCADTPTLSGKITTQQTGSSLSSPP